MARSFDLNNNDNLLVYWGQNSYGAVNPTDTDKFQKPIGDYCDDDTVDYFSMAFLTEYFSTGDLPAIDLSNTCNASSNGVFDGTNLAKCDFLSDGIKKCQKAGKAILLSLGGATGGGSFTDDDQAKKFADTVWNIFLGGSSDTRPFGDAQLDGVDLDVEGGGGTGYTAFVNQLHTHFDGADKTYYMSAAPQCPFPDAYLGTVLNEAPFSLVAVQFYNNYCGNDHFPDPAQWDYTSWDDWAKNNSTNKDVKLFIGAPASESAAGTGYVDASKLSEIATTAQSNYTTFGGIMLWDQSQSVANDNYGAAVKSAMNKNSAKAKETAKDWKREMIERKEDEEMDEMLRHRMSRFWRL